MNQPLRTDLQTVTAVTHWTDRLFSFRVTRPQSLRFRSGEFVMIGLPDLNGKPVLRAYSIASPAWDDELEFYSIKVPDGPLTSRAASRCCVPIRLPRQAGTTNWNSIRSRFRMAR